MIQMDCFAFTIGKETPPYSPLVVCSEDNSGDCSSEDIYGRSDDNLLDRADSLDQFEEGELAVSPAVSQVRSFVIVPSTPEHLQGEGRALFVSEEKERASDTEEFESVRRSPERLENSFQEDRTRDLAQETEEQALMADGIAVSEGQQICIAAAALVHDPKPEKKSKDVDVPQGAQ
ncbi:hypothetical protein EC968_003296 [Mortierella alpina]|nr:hypothetical protein EC968_003296 [Mortierella alpina]